MRAELLALARKSPHPAVPATFSPREKERRPRRACNSTVKRANPLPSRNLPPNLILLWRLVAAMLPSVLFSLQSKVGGTLDLDKRSNPRPQIP